MPMLGLYTCWSNPLLNQEASPTTCGSRFTVAKKFRLTFRALQTLLQLLACICLSKFHWLQLKTSASNKETCFKFLPQQKKHHFAIGHAFFTAKKICPKRPACRLSFRSNLWCPGKWAELAPAKAKCYHKDGTQRSIWLKRFPRYLDLRSYRCVVFIYLSIFYMWDFFCIFSKCVYIIHVSVSQTWGSLHSIGFPQEWNMKKLVDLKRQGTPKLQMSKRICLSSLFGHTKQMIPICMISTNA